MNNPISSNNLCNQETQTSISGSPPCITESPSNSFLVSHNNINNANYELITGISGLCGGPPTSHSLGEDGVLSSEFRQKLWTLFRQIEVEFEKECKRMCGDNYQIHDRNEKLESSDHDETNIPKKISSSHISQKIKQQYKQSKQSTSRFVSTLRDRGGVGPGGAAAAGGGGVPQLAGPASQTTVTAAAASNRPVCALCWRVTDHRDGLWECACLGRGLVATACADGVVRLWNTETNHCSLVYLGHSGSVNSVRFRGSLMLTASGDGTAHLLNLPPDKVTEAATANGDAGNKASVTDHIEGSAFEDPSQPYLNVSKKIGSNLQSEDGYDTTESVPVVLRHPSSMYQTASFYSDCPLPPAQPPQQSLPLAGSLAGPSGLSCYQDSAPLAAADFLAGRDQLVTASWDRMGRIYDVSTGCELASLTGHDLPLTDVRSCPGEHHHALAVTASRDSTFRLWDFRSGSTEVHVQQGHNGVVSSVNFVGGSSEKLVSAGADRYCKLWDLRHNRSPIKEIRTDSPINRLAVHPGGRLVALPMDNRSVKIVELGMGNRVARFPRTSSQSHSRIVTNVCWTADGGGKPNFFSVGFDHQLLAWQVQLPALFG